MRWTIWITLLLFILWATYVPSPLAALDHIGTAHGEWARASKRNLNEAIVDFWLPRSIDAEDGGYRISFDEAGNPTAKNTKGIVTQARMVWFFSRLAASGRGNRPSEEYLQAAAHGYQFLRQSMWDSMHGGFYWEVNKTGQEALKPAKHVYGQAFGLYAVSEYAMASGDPDALGFAIELFELLEEKAHDKEYGGYLEFFQSDWTEAPDDLEPYMGEGLRGMKLMNTHIHLMEAMTTFYRASKLPLAKERLIELIDIEANKVVRQEWGACTDKYARDWSPVLNPPYNHVSYGHDIQNVWLIMDAVDTAGLAQKDYHDLYKRLWGYSLTYGYDAEKGGFYYSGSAGMPAENRSKIWWVQAEALVSALRMYEMFGEDKYLDVFSQTFALVSDKQTDWEVGEWHWLVDEQGVGSGPKATIWKAAYHNGRAMLEGLASLDRLSN